MLRRTRWPRRWFAVRRCPRAPGSGRSSISWSRLESGALPVLDEAGHAAGLVQVEDLREVWNDARLDPVLVALDLMRPVRPVLAQAPWPRRWPGWTPPTWTRFRWWIRTVPGYPYGIVTRAGAQRVKRRVLGSAGSPAMAPTERLLAGAVRAAPPDVNLRRGARESAGDRVTASPGGTPACRTRCS